jgi:putative addiction module component (TIGR02574 family)
MNTAKSLDKKINNYLDQLSTKQKEAVLTVVKTFAEDHDDKWKDESFIAELDRRTEEYESGKAKVYTLDELETRVRKSYKAKGK